MPVETGKSLQVRPSPIAGLLVLELPVHGDNRGWFKENWQRAKFLERGFPDFGPVQNNISFNDAVGTTRGIHAEPWDKYISVASGRIFGAWVDLREGPGFGTVFTAELDPSRAVFVPRGVGNAYQTLEPGTAYTYLVNEHWSPDVDYTFLNLADETVAIEWPIPLARAELSAKDAAHPRLTQVVPMRPRPALVLGAAGQLGQALRAELPGARFVTRAEVDLTNPAGWDERLRWEDYGAIVNAAAYTAVDLAETVEGRAEAWAANAAAPGGLARIATQTGSVLVQVSTDYVFDGTREVHDEDEPLSPLGVYGQSKAAGEIAAGATPRRYIVRTSWVIGAGRNFVATMADLARRGVDPQVVDDQFGRLTFASDLAAGIGHLLGSGAPYGTYHLTNAGPVTSWYDIARTVFDLLGHDPDRVRPVSAADYAAGRPGVAPRPRYSTLALDKIEATGFRPRPAREALDEYLSGPTTPDGIPGGNR